MSGQDDSGTWAIGRLAHFSHDPDNISGQDMLSSRCYVRKCRVLLPKRVPDGKHHSFHSDGKHHSFHPDGNSHSFHLDVSQPQFYPANVLPYPHVSQPPFYPDDFPPSRIFHIWRLTPDGRGGRFKFPGQTYPDPLIALTRRVSQIFCTVPRCSPEASRYLPPTF